MSNDANQKFKIVQEFEVALPTCGSAMPIPRDDWKSLKNSIQKIDTEGTGFKDVGLLLLGAGISVIIAIITGAYSALPAKEYRTIAVAISVIMVCVGICCILFASKVKKFVRTRTDDVVNQMNQIEKRYNL